MSRTAGPRRCSRRTRCERGWDVLKAARCPVVLVMLGCKCTSPLPFVIYTGTFNSRASRRLTVQGSRQAAPSRITCTSRCSTRPPRRRACASPARPSHRLAAIAAIATGGANYEASHDPGRRIGAAAEDARRRKGRACGRPVHNIDNDMYICCVLMLLLEVLFV